MASPTKQKDVRGGILGAVRELDGDGSLNAEKLGSTGEVARYAVMYKRRTRHMVRSVDELLRLTESQSIQTLDMELWDDSPGDAHANLAADDDVLSGVSLFVGSRLESLQFPFTLNQFWNFVTSSYSTLERNYRLLDLPAWDSETELEDSTSDLAVFFEVSTGHLVDQLGGCWHPVDPEPLGRWFDGQEPIERWFAAGNPRLVLLGLTTDTAIVKVPDPVRVGYATEDQYEWRRWVNLGRTRELRDLRAAIQDAVAERRADLVLCKGCRRELAPELRQSTCADCRIAYYDRTPSAKS